jgi:hypothetical protein
MPTSSTIAYERVSAFRKNYNILVILLLSFEYSRYIQSSLIVNNWLLIDVK